MVSLSLNIHDVKAVELGRILQLDTGTFTRTIHFFQQSGASSSSLKLAIFGPDKASVSIKDLEV